jgi:hypothetical protein
MALATAAVAAVVAIRAGQTLDRETAPFRWTRLEAPGREIAVRHLRQSMYRAVLGFFRAMVPVLGAVAVATVLAILVLGLSRSWSEATTGLSVGGVLVAVSCLVGAGAVIWRLLNHHLASRDVPGRLFPLEPVALWFELTAADRSELGTFVLEQRQRSQQKDLDLVATESAAVLGRIRDLAPEDLRAVVTTQLVMWQPGTSWSASPAELLVRQTLRQVDTYLQQLERELAEGVEEAEAKKFWYTAVLRTVRRSAGPRALSGVLATGGESPGRSGARRRTRVEDAPAREEIPETPGSGVETVIDLRQVERGTPSDPTSHRHEA